MNTLESVIMYYATWDFSRFHSSPPRVNLLESLN